MNIINMDLSTPAGLVILAVCLLLSIVLLIPVLRKAIRGEEDDPFK